MGKKTILDSKIIQEQMLLKSVPEMTYQALRKTILTGMLKSGEWLLQRDLADELGVGTATVRQALCRLADEGLVVSEHYKGFRVIILGENEIIDRNDIQRALCCLAVEVAISTITHEDLEKMKELLPQTFASDVDPLVARKAHEAFHWTIFRSTGRDHLIRLLGQYWDSARWQATIKQNTPEEQEEWERMCRLYNTEIFDALNEHDGGRANRAYVEFWNDDLKLVLGLMRRIRPPENEEVS